AMRQNTRHAASPRHSRTSLCTASTLARTAWVRSFRRSIQEEHVICDFAETSLGQEVIGGCPSGARLGAQELMRARLRLGSGASRKVAISNRTCRSTFPRNFAPLVCAT